METIGIALEATTQICEEVWVVRAFSVISTSLISYFLSQELSKPSFLLLKVLMLKVEMGKDDVIDAVEVCENMDMIFLLKTRFLNQDCLCQPPLSFSIAPYFCILFPFFLLFSTFPSFLLPVPTQSPQTPVHHHHDMKTHPLPHIVHPTRNHHVGPKPRKFRQKTRSSYSNQEKQPLFPPRPRCPHQLAISNIAISIFHSQHLHEHYPTSQTLLHVN